MSQADQRKWLAYADHLRILKDLREMADALEPPLCFDFRDALSLGKPTSTPEETVAYFGDTLPTATRIIRPLIDSLQQVIPGFLVWLDVTGFGDDKKFCAAMLKWSEKLAAPHQKNATQNRAVVKLLSATD